MLGSHLVNYVTWGRFNHVAIVVDAARGLLAESTAHLPTDQPGVRVTDWKSLWAGYAHVGVVPLSELRLIKSLASFVGWEEPKRQALPLAAYSGFG